MRSSSIQYVPFTTIINTSQHFQHIQSSTMRYSPILACAFAATILAAPSASPRPCPAGLYSNPQCCDTDLLGILDLNCRTRTSHVSSRTAKAAVVI